jgi:hypothetical protein
MLIIEKTFVDILIKQFEYELIFHCNKSCVEHHYVGYEWNEAIPLKHVVS